jgi:hypothetical protein
VETPPEGMFSAIVENDDFSEKKLTIGVQIPYIPISTNR